MADHLTLAKAEDPPPREPARFVTTATAADIRLSVDLIWDTPRAAMTMVCGAPGSGKTCALEELVATSLDASMFTIAPRDGDPFGLAATLGQLFPTMKVNGRWLPAIRKDLTAWLSGTGHLLILDEAQNATPEGLEWIRVLVECAGIKLVLAGDLKLSRMVDDLPQLNSRMQRPIVIPAISSKDVAALAENFGVSGKDGLRLLNEAARKPGGLRNVESVLRLARAGSEDGTIDPSDIRPAMREMRLLSAEGDAQ